MNLRGFDASKNPRFKGGIPDFLDEITDFFYGKFYYILMWNIEKYTTGNLT